MSILDALFGPRHDVRSYGRDLTREVTRAADRTGRAASSLGRDARSELSGLWSRIEDIVGGGTPAALQDAGRLAGRYARDAGDLASHGAHRVAGVVRQRPIVAIGVAVAATYVIARLIGNRR